MRNIYGPCEFGARRDVAAETMEEKRAPEQMGKTPTAAAFPEYKSGPKRWGDQPSEKPNPVDFSSTFAHEQQTVFASRLPELSQF